MVLFMLLVMYLILGSVFDTVAAMRVCAFCFGCLGRCMVAAAVFHWV